jgi:aspartate/methionine/tyrosine aminotransferase
MAAVQAPVIDVIGEWMAETPGTISLGQGVVGYGPPPEAIAAARRFGAVPSDHLYGPIQGEPELRAALGRKLRDENGFDLDRRHLVVTAGCNMAFVHAMQAILDPGDEVIQPVPYYFNHEMAIRMAGGTPVPVPVRADYQLDLEAIAAAMTPRTRAVVTVSPNNPTGAVYDEASLRALNALCRERQAFHVHDETYEYFTYGVPHFSPGSIPGSETHTISLFSCSKAYGMASWRVGWLVAPERLAAALAKIQDTVLICAPVIAQRAAAAALGVGRAYVAQRLAAFDRMRGLVRAKLASADVPCDLPDVRGAFYHFVRVRTALDPMTLARDLIRQHGVAVVPGAAFGERQCAMRISYGALDEETVADGVDRLVRGLRALAGVLVLTLLGGWLR